MAEEGSPADVRIGEGTTALDWLCAIHPFLKIEIDELKRLRAEREAFQNRTQTLTCVYCAYEYPPGVPPSNHAALSAHIRECPQHPMKAAFDILGRVRQHLVEEDGESPARDPERQELISEIDALMR